MLLMVGFAGMASMAFSEVDARFGTFGQSLVSCFVMIISGFDMSSVFEERRVTSLLFVPFFTILFSYILLSILLAILEISFTAATAEISHRDEKVRKLNALMCCCLSIPKESPENEDAEREAVSLHTMLEVLQRMSVNSELRSHSIKYWAEELAEQIYGEKSTRKKFRRQILATVYKVPRDSVRNETKLKVRKAIKERKEHLHYLRIASQFCDFQIAGITHKIKDVERETEMKYNKHVENKGYFFKGEKLKKIMETRMRERYKKLRETALQYQTSVLLAENDASSQKLPRNN
eukprot:TRINITY_DN1974_c0_g1_i5.p1 TRINITY_DN1974_c0_g1~~TRINITY_DN1974_c0_g1_i5.p1  ORF type:complete len:292 (+),score=87.88 TRINITY_DN1974_c0_g1_i5:160-1035(+)